jgi:hypothetical protein
MMNRTLQYFKNIKFNTVIKNALANQGKKKYNTYNIKNRVKNCQQMTIRKFGTGTGSFNKPPFDNSWIIAAAFICGCMFNLKRK